MRKTAKRMVAIDGPAGSGKSTVARLLAKRLKLPYIDTGAMYRSLTWLARESKVPFDNKRKLLELAKRMALKFVNDGRDGTQRVWVNGRDISEAIRLPELTRQVHHVAGQPAIRKEMVKFQRKLIRSRGGVMEGRDIGTVVLPEAPFKFFLDADFKIRALRRFNELKAKKASMALAVVQKELKARDKKDLTRKVGPLRQAPDAIRIDTSHDTAQRVAKRLESLVRASRRRN